MGSLLDDLRKKYGTAKKEELDAIGRKYSGQALSLGELREKYGTADQKELDAIGEKYSVGSAAVLRKETAVEKPASLLDTMGGRGAAQLAQNTLGLNREKRKVDLQARMKELDEIEAELKAFEMATQYAPADQRPVKNIGGFTSSQAAREEYDRVMEEYADLLKRFGETDTDFGRNVRYALEKGGAGVAAAVEGLGDAAAALLLDPRVGSRFTTSPIASLGRMAKASSGVTEALERQLETNPSAERMQDIENRYAPSKAGRIAGEVSQGIGGMLPSIAANVALPGSGMALLGIQAGGQSAQEALNEGATLEQAVNHGTLTGAKEAATELMFGGLAGLGKGFLSTAAGKGVGKLISKFGASTTGKVLAALADSPIVKALADSLGEGIEEGVSAVLDPYIKRLTYNKEAENATVEEVLHDVYIGALTGGVFQGVGLAANLAAGQEKTASGVEAEESTAVDTNPAKHTPQEQAVIEEYQAQTNDELKALFEEHQANPKRGFSRKDISPVSERQAADASRLLGGNYAGYTNAINSNGVKHILNRHGPEGTADQSLADLNDAARMGYVLSNYDTVETATDENGEADLSSEFRTKENEPAPMLKFSKKVNGTYYVVEAVPESKYKKFWVVSAYMQTADGGTQALDAQGTGKSLASSLSAAEPTVPQAKQEVKMSSFDQAIMDAAAERRRLQAEREAANRVPEDPRMAAAMDELVRRSANAQKGPQERAGAQAGVVSPGAANNAQGAGEAAQGQKRKMPPGVTDLRRRVLSKKETDEVRSIERLAKAAGVSVYITEDLPAGEYGRYENGELYLSAWAKEPLMQVAKHEVTHHLQEMAPELYGEYRQYVERILSERGDLENAIRARMEVYAEAGRTLDREAALDEAAADFTEELMLDEGLFRRLAQEDRSLAQRILDTLKALLARLKRTLSGGEVNTLEKASRAWEAALKETSAQKNTAPASGAVKSSYAGVKARTADLDALEQAQELERREADGETIRRQTGWFRGADGKWRFELDDSGMQFRKDGDARLMQEPGYKRLEELTDKWAQSFEGGKALTPTEEAELDRLQEEYSERVWGEKYMLTDFVKHDALYEAYPRLRGVSLIFDDLQGGTKGLFSKRSNTIVLSNELFGKEADVVLHEIQHVIQKIEGFSGGASPEYWRNRMEGGYSKRTSSGLEMMPTDLYKNTAGEIEARDAARRRTMSAEQRRANRPDTGDENTVFAEGSAISAEIDPNFAREIDQWDGQQVKTFRLGATSDALRSIGVDDRNIILRSEKVKEILKKHGGMSREVIKQMPQVLEDPVMVLNSRSGSPENRGQSSRIAIFGEVYDERGAPVTAVLELRPTTEGGELQNFNLLVSTYGKDKNLQKMVEESDVLYLDPDKKRTDTWLQGIRLQLPSYATTYGSMGSISYEGGFVNIKGVPWKRLVAEGNDGKSSLSGVKELEQRLADLQRQNERLRARNEQLKGQMKRSRGAKTDEAEVKRTAGELLKEFSSRYDRTELAGRLQALYDGMADPNGENSMTEPEMRREARSIAERVLGEASVLNDDVYREYSDLRNFLRTTKMLVPQDLWGDLDSEGGYNEFRKRNMGRLSLSSTEGRGIDDVYQELSYDYPGLFDQDAVSHPADQLIQMAKIAGNLRPTYENPYARDLGAVDWLAGEIMERFYDLPQQKGTFADRAAARVEEVLQRERQAARERLQAELKRQEERHQKKLDNIRQSNREAGKRMRENMSATKLRDTIKRHAEGLSRKLTRPTDKQHIPERLRGSVLALLEVIDLESKYGYQFTREATFKRVNREDGGLLEPTARTNAARALKAAYEELRSDPEFNGTVDPDLADMLEEIAGMGDVRVADMSLDQLQTVWKAVRAVEASVTKADKMLGASKYGRVSAAADALKAEVGDRKDRNNLVGVLGSLDRMINLDMLTPETFLHRMGKVGEDIHRQMRRAQDKNVEILKEGIETYRRAAEETGVDLLKAEKELHEFKLPDGTIELTTAQVMELYALSKREAAMEHIYKGGLRAKGGRKGLVETGKSKAVKVTLMDVADILEVLTPEQKKLVDTLQNYMSTRLAAHGNEASMEAYDYEKFKEKAYWPIKVSKSETDTDPAAEARAKTIPGFGMTKALQPHANNSVELRSALDTFGEHLNQMATYAAWLTTSENITKLVNYDFMAEGTRLGTVKDLLAKVYGKGGEQYLTKLLSDIAQGTKTGSGEGALTDSMFGRWKAAKVGANLRVILQQPTAIIRAAEMIDPKYMARIGNPKKGWEKAVEWAPIAQWKDWGYFEMDAGRSMRELMAGTGSKLDKVKNAAMKPAGAMDSLAWGMLWNAVEAETMAKRAELAPGSDEFYRTVAERFSDVIDRTQVVDSVLHRTQIMRSSNALNRMATSFMSEPGKIYNMVARDIYDIRTTERGSEANKKAWKHVARTGVALTASFAVNAVAQSVVDALRDDDRDKELEKKFGDAWLENFFQNFDPLGYLPYVKDMESIIQGFTVDRSDMEGLADLVQAAKTLVKVAQGGGNKTMLDAGTDALGKALDALGLPASNIKRDVMGILSTVLQETGAHELTYKVDKLMLDIKESGNAGVYYDTLYRAMNGDYEAYVKIYKDMVKNGMEPEKIASGMEKRMAEELGLSSTIMLPVDYHVPGAYVQFDQMLRERSEAGETWADGVDPEQVSLALELEYIKSESGANKKRMRAIADSGYSERTKEKAMGRVMGMSAYSRYLTGRDAGISTEEYVDLLEAIDAATLERRGESGNASQEDVLKALQQSGLSSAQKRAVWYSYGYKTESPWG